MLLCFTRVGSMRLAHFRRTGVDVSGWMYKSSAQQRWLSVCEQRLTMFVGGLK